MASFIELLLLFDWGDIAVAGLFRLNNLKTGEIKSILIQI